MKLTFRLPKEKKGGAGSGHFGHAGRPGKRGGSTPGTGGGGSGSSKKVAVDKAVGVLERDDWNLRYERDDDNGERSIIRTSVIPNPNTNQTMDSLLDELERDIDMALGDVAYYTSMFVNGNDVEIQIVPEDDLPSW